MNKLEFEKKMNTEETELDNDFWNIIRKSIDTHLDGNPRGHRNLIIVMEELAELTQEVSKEIRGKGDRASLMEELADVQLAIYYIQEICGIHTTDLIKAMNVKLHRVNDVLTKDGEYL